MPWRQRRTPPAPTIRLSAMLPGFIFP
jgi:hypothetical protein